MRIKNGEKGCELMSENLKTLIENYNSLIIKFDELKIEIETLHNNNVVCENRLRDLLQMGANAKSIGIEIPYIVAEIKEVENSINQNKDTIGKLGIEISDVSYKCVKLEDILDSYRVNFDELQNKINSHKCHFRSHYEDTVDTKFRSYICDECGEIIAII